MSEMTNAGLLALTARIVTAHVENNVVAADTLPDLIQSVYQSLATAGVTTTQPKEPQTPAVPVRRSVFPDCIVCLEDGRKLKTLKRHLKTHHGLSTDEYRAKWGLPSDYPMVAPDYAEIRSGLAKSLGLGRTQAVDADALERAELGDPDVTIVPARRARGSRG